MLFHLLEFMIFQHLCIGTWPTELETLVVETQSCNVHFLIKLWKVNLALSSWSFRGLIILVSLHYGPCSTSCSVGNSTFSGELSWCLPSLSCPQLQVTIPYPYPWEQNRLQFREKWAVRFGYPLVRGKLPSLAATAFFTFNNSVNYSKTAVQNWPHSFDPSHDPNIPILLSIYLRQECQNLSSYLYNYINFNKQAKNVKFSLSLNPPTIYRWAGHWPPYNSSWSPQAGPTANPPS